MHDAGRLGQIRCVRVRVCVCCVCCVCVCCVCIYNVCISKLSNCLCCCRYEWTHTQTHTLTTYGVNKLQAIAQGLNWSEVREREKRGRKLDGERMREVTGRGARQLASVELSIALWLRILWPQVNSLTNAEHIYLFTSAAVAVAISISNSSSNSCSHSFSHSCAILARLPHLPSVCSTRQQQANKK